MIDSVIQKLTRGLKHATLLSLFVLMAGCAGNDEQKTIIQDLQDGYTAAKEAALRGNHRRAIQIYELIQARYPFSNLSKQVQLELMYSYYKIGQPELAVESADTFMRENPIDPRVDYALYIKGLTYFENDPSIVERVFKRDINRRPPKDAELAYSTFARLIERYPASKYAPDAQQRIVYLKNRLGAYENTVADYYLRRGAYVAALKRAKTSLEEFNGASSNARSLEIMAEAYEELGMMDMAADTRRILQKNFPNRG
ncbi:MAG: outer membrane protein assembly factor BamD [Woeseiaceae bacterium]|nr:outer membrane protein assembly factor BamD [Woeseiaceae bacterium]